MANLMEQVDVSNHGGLINAVMSTATFKRESKGEWRADDPRLLRAAERIIRLYDLGQITLYSVEPQSLAALIAQELNQDLNSDGQ